MAATTAVCCRCSAARSSNPRRGNTAITQELYKKHLKYTIYLFIYLLRVVILKSEISLVGTGLGGGEVASQRRGSLAGAPCRGAGGGGTGGEQRTTAPPRQAADMARGEGHHPPRDGGSATQRCHDGDGGERNVRDGERTDLSPRQVEIAGINLVMPQTRPRGVRDGVPYTITTHHPSV